MKDYSIYIGYDAREHYAYRVAQNSIRRRLSEFIPIHSLVLSSLQNQGLYWREIKTLNNNGAIQLWDEISENPMSTEFAISRFLTPKLAKHGYALFMDCDMLARCDLAVLFNSLDDSKAVWCVKHAYEPKTVLKMDNQLQTFYRRKNWTSFIIFNCDHPSNQRLTLEMVNTLPGRDLHALCWLQDDEIGELPATYNHLVGEHDHDANAKIVHWTLGGPWLDQYKTAPFADEWFSEVVNLRD